MKRLPRRCCTTPSFLAMTQLIPSLVVASVAKQSHFVAKVGAISEFRKIIHGYRLSKILTGPAKINPSPDLSHPACPSSGNRGARVFERLDHHDVIHDGHDFHLLAFLYGQASLSEARHVVLPTAAVEVGDFSHFLQINIH